MVWLKRSKGAKNVLSSSRYLPLPVYGNAPKLMFVMGCTASSSLCILPQWGWSTFNMLSLLSLSHTNCTNYHLMDF